MVQIAWEVQDGDWSYMNVYLFTEEEYKNLTPDQLLEKQTTEYLKWREYCSNPQG